METIGSVYLTTKELCEWLKISINTALNWRNKNGMPYVKIDRAIRYEKEAVENWLENQKIKK